MTKNPSITSAEWTVMQVLWRNSPLTAVEVFEALEGQSDWHPKTVRTLLGRLEKKGALRREKRTGSFRFIPVVSEEQCVSGESQSFLERCFSGMATPMLAHFIEHENLSAEDIAALRTILEKKATAETGNDGC